MQTSAHMVSACFCPLNVLDSSISRIKIGSKTAPSLSRTVKISCVLSFRSEVRRRFRVSAFSQKNQENELSQAVNKDFAILLEVEGVLADNNLSGNCHSFNVAFKKLGLDCANWTEPVYMDLVRKAGGDDKRMLTFFFDKIGWPTSLPTDEKEPFLKNVLQEKKLALEEILTSSSISLRPGIQEFINDAQLERIPVVILAAFNKIGEKASRHIIEKLAPKTLETVKVIGKEDVEATMSGKLLLGKGISSDIAELLADEAAEAVVAEKQRIAREVASVLKVSVDINTGDKEITKSIIASLRAGAECVGKSVDRCILIAGNQTGLLAAERIGMPCIVMKSSSTSRGEFPTARAVSEEFGPGGLTLSRLCRIHCN